MSNLALKPEDKEDIVTESDHYDMRFRTVTSHTLDITLSKDIENDFVYSKLLATLRDLPPNVDKIELRISNFGGSSHSMIELYNAFNEAAVPVHVIVTAPSYSAASFIALSGDTLEFKKGSWLMFHNYSGIEIGKAGEMLKAVTEYKQLDEQLINEVYFPFLTKKEIKELSKDQDVYVTYYTPDLTKRIKRFERAKRNLKKKGE